MIKFAELAKKRICRVVDKERIGVCAIPFLLLYIVDNRFSFRLRRTKRHIRTHLDKPRKVRGFSGTENSQRAKSRFYYYSKAEGGGGEAGMCSIVAKRNFFAWRWRRETFADLYARANCVYLLYNCSTVDDAYTGHFGTEGFDRYSRLTAISNVY